MDLLSAIRSVRLFSKQEDLKRLTTVWGENLDTDHVLPEYPRPHLVRTKDNSYINLNGYWDYAIVKDKYSFSSYDGKILVPFSPEAALSGVGRQLQPDELLFCERTITIDELPTDGSRCILHFGAVDQYARVFLNGQPVISHLGGYLPFSADITKYLQIGSNLLSVQIEDRSDTSYHSVGKQKLKRGGMFYTAQSGIWQTVWMEWVPSVYITDLKLTPHYDKETIHVCIQMNTPLPVHHGEDSVICYVLDQDDQIVSKGICTNQSDCLCTYSCYCDVNHMISWTPDYPYLYKLKVCAGTDKIISYFAIDRKSVV